MKELITKENLFVKDTDGEMVLAQNAVEAITNIETQMKALDKEYKKYKAALLDGMEKYGLKRVETDDILISYIEPTERVSLDQSKLKEEYKDVYFKCQKISPVKSSVRVTVR